MKRKDAGRFSQVERGVGNFLFFGPLRSGEKQIYHSGTEKGERSYTECTEERWRTQRKTTMKDYRCDAEGAEEGNGEAATRLTLWQAGAQQAASLPRNWCAQ